MKLLWTAIACSCVVGACVSSRPDHFYVLTVQPPLLNAPRPAPRTQVTLNVSVPSVLDRPELVLNTSADGVAILDHERWAAPLPDLVLQTLARDLENRRSDLIVVDRNMSRPGFATLRVTVEIGQIATRPGTAMSIAAHFRIVGSQASTDIVGRETFTVPLGREHAALAQALSACLSQLADRLIQQMPAG